MSKINHYHFNLLFTELPDIFHHLKTKISEFQFLPLIDIFKRDKALDIDYHKA
jgi:hypothetical protein